MTSSTNDCKWKRYKNKHIGEYFTCDTNDNIYKTIHLAKYPKKGCAFDKEKIKRYKDVLGKKEDMKDVQNLTKNLKKLHIQLYDGKKDGSVVMKKGFKIISKGKNGWKPIVPITSLITSKQQRGGRFCEMMEGFKTQCDVLCSMKQNTQIVDKKPITNTDNQYEKREIQILEKCFSLGNFPDDFVNFTDHLTKLTHTSQQAGSGNMKRKNKKDGCADGIDKPFLFFSNTNAFINRTLWGDTNDDTTPIVPYTPKRKRENTELGDAKAITEWKGVLDTLFKNLRNELNILNIVTAPLHYIVPLNIQGALGNAPREWHKRGDVVKRIADSVIVLKKLFKLNETTTVNVINLHLYSPEVEMYNYMHIDQDYRSEMLKNIKEADPKLRFQHEESLRKFFTDEIKSQISGENKKLKFTGLPVENVTSHDKYLYFCDKGKIFGTKNMSIESFISQMKINMIYCAGGETHWLHRQMKANGMFNILQKQPKIIWSGFSAGVINAGYTTAMAAEKVFNILANPSRKTGEDASADDITALQKDDGSGDDCKVYEINVNGSQPPSLTLKHERTPKTCDTKAANWYNCGIVYPHFREKWGPMILDVLSKKNASVHFKDIKKIMILADGECVHNLNSNENIERLPKETKPGITMSSYGINIARCFSEAVNANINNLPNACDSCPS
jgi:hypothetical protein